METATPPVTAGENATTLKDVVLRLRWLVLFALAAFVAVAAPAQARVVEAAPPQWAAATPPDGQTFIIDAGATLKVQLGAVAADPTAAVQLSATGAPARAAFAAVPGNPATATFTWTPSFRDIGRYEVTFLAQVAGATDAPLTRTIELQVRKPPPFKLSGVGEVSRSAYVARATYARAEPRLGARVVSLVPTLTPELAPNLVLALGGAYDAGGRLWVRVRLAILPNNATAWVPRDALGPFRSVTTHLIVSRAQLRMTLYRSGRIIFRARVGVGRPYWPTPRGEYYVRERLSGFGDPMYGPLAFGLNARSNVLTDWPGGGFIGIHGTDEPQLLPGRVSHGCVRMRNPDILRLAPLLPLGTPVSIV